MMCLRSSLVVWCIVSLPYVFSISDISNEDEKQFLTEDLIEQLWSTLLDHIREETEFLSNSSSCFNDLNTLWSSEQKEAIVGSFSVRISKLILALDAFGKPQSGFIRGNTKYIGDYDECFGIDTKPYDFSMQYCQVSVSLSVNKKPLSLSDLVEAVCIPSSCLISDVEEIVYGLNEAIAVVSDAISVFYPHLPDITVNVTKFVCTSQDGVPFSAGAQVMIAISFLFGVLVSLATAADLLLYFYWFMTSGQCDSTTNGLINDNILDRPEPFYESDALLVGHRRPKRFVTFLYDVFKGFSLYKTVPAILSTKQPPTAITSINGMRVISMFWVIMCHTYIFSYGGQGFANAYDFAATFLPRFTAQAILNGFFSVDSFFFLSGLLVAYLTFRHMKRNNGRFPFFVYYIHRFLRLTPTYMFLLFFYWFVTVHMGNGPNLALGFSHHSLTVESCRKYWWSNLLYINNFVPNSLGKECMAWSWYLANDMQFHVVAPLVLIPLYYWLPSGILALCILLLASFGVTGFIAGYYGYSANVFYALLDPAHPPPPDLPDESSQIYVKPYCRITPYLVGIFLGYLLYRKFRVPVSTYVKAWGVHLFLWLVALILGLVNVYGLYFSWHGHKLTSAENILYYMLSRFTWGVTLALVVFLCHNGYGGVINRFLSLPIWIPLSRLTFNAYLVHETVMVLLFSELRSTLYYTDTIMMIYCISMIVVSYGAAGVVAAFVEYPIANLEAAVFKLCGVPLRMSTRRVEEKPDIRGDTSSPLETAVRIS